MTTRTTKTFILLEDGMDHKVLVSPASKDKFMMSVAEVIEGCTLVSKQIAFVNQFYELSQRLVSWSKEREDRIHSAYASLRSNGTILVVVVQNEVACDFSLLDDLSDLSSEVACDEQFNLLSMETLSLPRTDRESLGAFLSSGRVVEYAGESDPRSCS